MMTIPLVTQLRFTRREFERVLAGISAEHGEKRLLPINSIGWTVGHIANHEQWCWVVTGQKKLVRELAPLFANGAPASTPPLAEMVSAWREITAAADPFLDTLTEADLGVHWLGADGEPVRENVGVMFHRLIYHYWFHIGEIHAARQLLEGGELPQFVGDMDVIAPLYWAS